MAKFLIEVSHEPEKTACLRAVEVFLKSGSHYLTNADWGCRDGDHRAWIMIEANSKEDARSVLPTAYRPQARVVGLNKFSLDEIEENLRHHGTPMTS